MSFKCDDDDYEFKENAIMIVWYFLSRRSYLYTQIVRRNKITFVTYIALIFTNSFVFEKEFHLFIHTVIKKVLQLNVIWIIYSFSIKGNCNRICRKIKTARFLKIVINYKAFIVYFKILLISLFFFSPQKLLVTTCSKWRWKNYQLS